MGQFDPAMRTQSPQCVLERRGQGHGGLAVNDFVELPDEVPDRQVDLGERS